MSDDLVDDLDALFDSIVAQRPDAAEPAAQAADSMPEPTSEPAPELAPELVQESEPAQELKLAENAPPVSNDLPPLDKEQVPMFQRLGVIVRELHDALHELGQDRSLFDAVHEVFDSQERLKYIASLTEQAANKVLNAVDESLPAQDSQVQQAHALSQRWEAMFEGRLSVDEFKQLAADSRDFSAAVVHNSEAEKARLMDIMMAQDFQDITGQIIKKVVSLTSNLELQLTQMLRDYAPTIQRSFTTVNLLSGPDVPTASMMQDDVDSLLGDLGF